MIDWLYRLNLDLTIIVIVILVLRMPVRKYLGAQVVHWLWLVPIVRFVINYKAEIPLLIHETISVTEQSVSVRVFNNPDNYIVLAPMLWVSLWLFGSLVWLIIRVVAWRRFNHILNEVSSQVDITNMMPHATKLDGLQQATFYVTQVPQAPFVTGVFKPCVYLPQESFGDLSKVQQQCILKHELTHIKRKDLWWQMMAELMRMVLWFNPVMHLAWRAFRQDQELACDHQVLAKSDADERYEYGMALLNGLHVHVLPSVAAAFFSEHKQRIMLLEQHKSSKVNTAFGALICVAFLSFSLVKAPKKISSVEPSAKLGQVSFKFKNIPLRSLLMLLADTKQRELQGLQHVPEVNITLEANHVSADRLQQVVLKCSGLHLQNQNYQLTLIKIYGPLNGSADTAECVESFH